MKQIDKFEYKRPDQIVEVWEREEGKRFFVYRYRGSQMAVFLAENSDRFVRYADSILYPETEPLFEITIDHPDVQAVDTMSRQGTMFHMVMEFIVNYESIDVVEL